MKKSTRTLGVDEFIKANLREPDRFAHTPDIAASGPQETDPDSDKLLAYFRMSEANLNACLVFYEREALFAGSQTERRDAKVEVSRAKTELRRRKMKKYSDATELAFLGEQDVPVAVNDAEANWQRATRKETA